MQQSREPFSPPKFGSTALLTRGANENEREPKLGSIKFLFIVEQWSTVSESIAPVGGQSATESVRVIAIGEGGL